LPSGRIIVDSALAVSGASQPYFLKVKSGAYDVSLAVVEVDKNDKN
jgi:hypothetical protein